MRPCRLFYYAFIAVFLLIIAERHACAQTSFPVEFRKNGVDVFASIIGNHVWYGANNSCLTHRTSKDNSFAHVHVDVPSTLAGYVPATNPATGAVIFVSIGTFTLSDVKAFWDNYFFGGAGGRANMANISTYGSENLTRNCWGYSLGYDTWIQDPAPIYNDDYAPLANPNFPSSTGSDVIRMRNAAGKDTHVLTISIVHYQESFYPVTGTAEKFRHSGVYYIIYGWSGCELKDYWRVK